MNPAVLAALVGAIVAASFGALATAFSPPRVRRRPPRDRNAAVAWGNPQRVVIAVVVAIAVLVWSRWPVGALAGGAAVAFWPWLSSTSGAAQELAKVEAIAKWLEDLRDLLRRSSIGVEVAVEMVGSTTTSGPLAQPLATVVLRRRQGARLTVALWELAETVDHATADSAVAALQLVLDGSAGGARLHDTLEELAAAARDEVRARQEVHRIRKVYQRAMRRLVVLTACFIFGLLLLSSNLLSPYRSPLGQMWLVVPVGVWAGCMIWLRSLMKFDSGARYRLRRPDAVVQA